MSKTNTATKPAAPVKRGPGRPRKVDPRDAELAALKADLERLRSATVQGPTLAPIPAASEERRPGTYFQQGVDGNGAPIMGKVRWTKRFLEETYAPVSFIPKRDMTISPHGITYRVIGGEENTVPCIVKDLYDGVIEGERIESLRHRPITTAEAEKYAQDAANQPGARIWSRFYRSGVGLAVRGPEPIESSGDGSA